MGPLPRRRATHAAGPRAGLTWGQPRACVMDDISTVAGGTERDGAAVPGHAGACRLHLRILRIEGYRLDKVGSRMVAGIFTGGEALRRPSDGDVDTTS